MSYDPLNRKNGVNGTNHAHSSNGYQNGTKSHNSFFQPGFYTLNVLVEEDVTDEDVPTMDWVENLGLFVLHDRRVIQRENRQFCMRMIDFLSRTMKTRLAHIDLDRHELVVQFSNPLTSRAAAAKILGDVIRLAAMPLELGRDFSHRSHWSCFTSFVSEQGSRTYWYSQELGQGRLRLYGSQLKEIDLATSSLLHLIPSMTSVHKRFFRHGLTIRYDSSAISPLDLVGAIDTVCRLEAAQVLPDEDENPLASISLPIRAWHLSLAAFSFGGAVVGIVVPGIPTVPFVLLTSYHLAKGSTKIHRFFLKMPLFGSVAHDWTDGRYIRTENKFLLIVITASLIGVTLVLTEISVSLLITVFIIFCITTWSVLITPSHPQSGAVPKVGMSRGLRALPGLSS